MKKEMPLVSIVVPCYNHEAYIGSCIQSIIQQTYENIELIIIDDGSIDNSINQVKELIDLCQERFSRFEFRSRPNKGLSTTLNEAIEWCKGKYYCAIASDDEMLPNKTQVQVDFLEKNNDYSAVFGGVIIINEKGVEITKVVPPKQRSYNHKEIILHKHNLPAVTQLIRLEAIKNTGGYKPDLKIEDWYMWLKLSENSDLYLLNTIVCKYRQHRDNTSQNFVLMRKARLEVLDYFSDSHYYDQAIKEAEWVSHLDNFMLNKNIYNFMKLFLINPKSTLIRGCKFILR